ncbi:LuxR C-terminal-related transcriptional regulator [Streptomyces europaeiscabiei]|uniref:LuxR C-terminal-related transcriptional regulator n=1 Tax=Streptomyces europaeiscabiei TaxID=146819 RepID=UPI0029B75F43|nr:LuxR C-terminal-related transcriptional regulator [Streptomyces europaeiscabiei]MDX3692507.1 LuxR C-terminal-related transcriptional regulator [Streptomyces europaeiscabiei]
MARSGERGSGPADPCADPQGDPFLRTRFAVPARPATFLRRKRLVDHLDQALTTPLTVVNGAAGAGKTLLVADWAAHRDRPVAWLTTEAGDQGPGMFWAYFLQTLRAAGVPLPPDIGCPADAGRVDRTLLTRLAEELGARERPVIVVLDEYDRVTDPEIADQLEFVLHHGARGLRLILVTRTEPLLPLHRHRTAGDMTEIRNAELAFTPEEAAVLLGLHGLRLPVTVAEALVERTRGWAAGLRLCALAAGESPDPETYLKRFEAERTAVADFLLAEVLERQTPETQDLLLRVSVLDRFRPELADALTERADAGGILAGLHRGNAFVEDLGHTWYRLHPLFGEILRAHLRMRRPGLEPVLHRRAAQWLRRSGTLAETLGHGAAAGDWEFTAGALVDDLAIGQLFTGLRSDDLAELFSRMGPEATSPAANLVRAARELSRCELDRGLTHLRHAERSLVGEEERAEAEDEPGPAAARLSCLMLEALAARLTGSPGRAELAAGTAERLREQVPAHLLDQHPELTALLLSHLGSARLWAGNLDEARAALSLVADGSVDASTALPREDSLGRLALIDYLNGWLGRAERKAMAALTVAERYSLPQPSDFGIGRLVLAAVAVDRDELRLARAHLDAAVGAHPTMRDPVTEAGRALATARLLLAQGDTRAALAAAEPAVAADVASPWAEGHMALVASAAHLARGRPEAAAEVLHAVPGHQPVCAVGEARARLAAGTPRAAIDLLDGVLPESRTGPAVTVRALLVRAEAAHAVGDSAAVRRLVAQALHDARRERLRRPFAEAGGWLRPVLGTAPLRGLAAGWLTPGPPPLTGAPAPEDRPPVVEELSGRERDVLRRLDRMMSTEEIAADLCVSVNTVKTHLKSVFRKLAVNRRNDAVRRARELRLL